MKIAVIGQSDVMNEVAQELSQRGLTVGRLPEAVTNADAVFVNGAVQVIPPDNVPTVVVGASELYDVAAVRSVSSAEVVSLLPELLDWCKVEKKKMKSLTDKLDVSCTRVGEFLKRTGVVMLLGAVLIFGGAAGCKNSPVHLRDAKTIRNWQEARQAYVEDVSAAAGLEDPAELAESYFPINADPDSEFEGLTWDVYESRLVEFDSRLFYEMQKRNPGDAAGVDNPYDPDSE